MSRRLDDLESRFRLVVFEFLARLVEAGIPVMVIDTLRTPAEHAANLAAGRSWTQHSKHLDGLAIDVCPYDQFLLRGPDKLAWNSEDGTWQKIGVIGERLGMRWGGRWQQKDMGHFEMNKAQLDALDQMRV